MVKHWLNGEPLNWLWSYLSAATIMLQHHLSHFPPK